LPLPTVKALVLEYMEHLKDNGTGSLSPRLSAIKRLAQELEDNGAIDHAISQRVMNIKTRTIPLRV
jgi:hypothetical protein